MLVKEIFLSFKIIRIVHFSIDSIFLNSFEILRLVQKVRMIIHFRTIYRWKYIFEIIRIVHFESKIELFSKLKRYWMPRTMFHTYDFDSQKNISHKQSVLFYGPSCSPYHVKLSWVVMIRSLKGGFPKQTCVHVSGKKR